MQRIGARKTPLPQSKLGSLIERDETPEGPQSTLNAILSSPTASKDPTNANKLSELAALETPKTLPRPAHAEMHPKEVHQTTTKAPDSGLRLGFADISTTKANNAIAAAQATPSKTGPRASLPQHLTAASFDFKFASESNLSEEARKLMNNVREDAERIKQHMRAEKDTQERKDSEAERLFGGINATGRKIAKPQGKAGRFSDVHMAQFKKMDSIANHPSSFRAKPNFAQPTQQSLKRSGSKAGLDENERPRTAGKGTPGRQPPPFGQPNADTSPAKPLPKLPPESERLENDAPAKRRKSTYGDISAGRAAMKEDDDAVPRPSTLPRPKSGQPTSLLTPTKASLARSNTNKVLPSSPGKISFLPRSNSAKSLKAASERPSSSHDHTPVTSPPKQMGLVRSESTKSIRPLPPLPIQASAPTSPYKMSILKALPTNSQIASSPSKSSLSKSSLTSKLPTFQGLRSILRSTRRAASKSLASPTKDISAGGTPKRPNTAAPSESGSTKKVDFTPSTKSRYAVKLAAASPSPSKLPRANTASTLFVTHDPVAYTPEGDSNEDWEDAECEVDYPVLPTGDDDDDMPTAMPPILINNKTFTQKAKEHSRRESKEFKSIFTTLEHPSRSHATLTDVNTKVNVRGPGGGIGGISPSTTARAASIATAKPSPSTTIRRVRPSMSSGEAKPIQPFEDTIKTVPHGLPGKKRRYESLVGLGQHMSQSRSAEGKENQNVNVKVPGGWDEGDAVDEGEMRAGKRAKFAKEQEAGEDDSEKKGNTKVKSRAREEAVRNARGRKSFVPPGAGAKGKEGESGSGNGNGRGILSMARLNVLSRPKERR